MKDQGKGEAGLILLVGLAAIVLIALLGIMGAVK